MFKFFNTTQTKVHTIAYTMIGVSSVGMLFAIIRDRIFAYHLGAGELLDVYIASFRIPDLLFLVTTSLISVYALLPVFEQKKQEGEVQLQKFVNTSFYFLCVFLVIGVAIFFHLIPYGGKLLFSGFSAEQMDMFVTFSRIFIIQAVLFSLSSFFTAILQLKRKFILFAFLPSLYNLGIIAGALFLYPHYGMLGIVCGVLVGAMLHFCSQIPLLASNNIIPRLLPDRENAKAFWTTIRKSILRSFTLVMYKGGEIVILGFLVALSQGAISMYYFADNIRSVPLLIIGIAFVTASFPILVEHAVKKDTAAFVQTMEYSLRKLTFFLVPIVTLMCIFSTEIIQLLFETGSFTATNTKSIATIFSVFVFGAVTVSAISLLARASYALGKTHLPLVVVAFLILAEIISVYLIQAYGETLSFVHTLHRLLETPSLNDAILFSIVGNIVLLEVIASLFLLLWIYRTLQASALRLLKNLGKIFFASLVAAVCALSVKAFIGGQATLLSLAGIGQAAAVGTVGMVVWYVMLLLVRNEDALVIHKHGYQMIQNIWNR